MSRTPDGNVEAVDTKRAVELAAGDVVLMKGGLWERGTRAAVPGAAHRAPAIGPVPTCTTHRLMLKVDVCADC